MQHMVELAVLLLLMATGHGVVNVAPEVVQRVARSFVLWLASFAAAIALFSIPSIVSAVVRLGFVLVGAYLVRWVVGDIVHYWRGPYLMAIPDRSAIADAVRRVTGRSPGECRLLAARMLCDHDEILALLGLVFTSSEAKRGEANFGDSWAAGCEKARASVLALAERYSDNSQQGRPAVFDMRFLAQALCVYEPKVVDRILKQMPAPVLGSRARRAHVAAELEKSGRKTHLAERLGAESHMDELASAVKGGGLRLWSYLVPPMELARSGYAHRAVALGISMALLFGYGLVSVLMKHSSGWIYLAVGVLIHIEAMFALADFRPVTLVRDPPKPGRRKKG